MNEKQPHPDDSTNGHQVPGMPLTGYQLTKAFYTEVEQNEPMQLKVSAHHHSLYTWICELRNRVKREVLDLPIRYTMQMAFIGSDKTLKSCIDDLEKWGVIDVLQRGSNQHVSTKVKLAVAFLRKHCDSTATADDSAVAFLREQYDSTTIALRTTKTSIKNKNNKTINASDVPSFDSFWQLYALKLGRFKSEQKWAKLSDQDKRDIMAVLPTYVQVTPEGAIPARKNPITFLTQHAWKDEDIGRSRDPARPPASANAPATNRPQPTGSPKGLSTINKS